MTLINFHLDPNFDKDDFRKHINKVQKILNKDYYSWYEYHLECFADNIIWAEQKLWDEYFNLTTSIYEYHPHVEGECDSDPIDDKPFGPTFNSYCQSYPREKIITKN